MSISDSSMEMLFNILINQVALARITACYFTDGHDLQIPEERALYEQKIKIGKKLEDIQKDLNDLFKELEEKYGV